MNVEAPAGPITVACSGLGFSGFFGSSGKSLLDQQVVAWSKVRFLMDTQPEAFAAFLGGVKGQLDAQGYPDGSDLPGLQRRLLKDLLGWTPADLDTAWTEWAQQPR